MIKAVVMYCSSY